MNYTDYKIGDKVIVLDTKELRNWTNGEEAVGKVFILTEEDISFMKTATGVIFLGDNKYGINYYPGMYKLYNENWDE